ncbi:MAG: hypothetical protein JNM93_06025 [Bacteriovoracaceae bacterium]|nr:hypothetical protein [Bacteriovoracaceae bacterium]
MNKLIFTTFILSHLIIASGFANCDEMLEALNMLKAEKAESYHDSDSNKTQTVGYLNERYNKECANEPSNEAGPEKSTANTSESGEPNIEDIKKLVVDYVAKVAPSDGDKDIRLFNNPSIYCNKPSDLTLDFNDCADAINAYNAAFISENAVLNPGIQVSQISAQTQATQQVAQNPLNPTAGLNAVEGVVQNQQTNETIKASFYGANAIMLGSLMAGWKTQKWLLNEGDGENKSKCEEALGSTANCKFLYKYLNEHPSEKSQYFANQRIKGFFTSEITRYAGQSAMSGVLAGQYAKQKNLIDGVQEDLKDFQDDLQEMPTMDACSSNPTLPGCANSNRTSYGPVGQGNFAITGDANTTGFNSDVLDASGGNNPDKLSAAQQEALASGLANLGGNPSATAKDVAPGAGYYEAAAGGGGGGGRAGGSGGGGSGAAPLSDTPGELDNQAKDASEIKVGKTSMAYSSGKGLANSKSSNREYKDPFGGLFDSDKKKTGGVVVDRNLASDIDAGNSLLFEKISKRYGKVIDEKRLVEVEVEK